MGKPPLRVPAHGRESVPSRRFDGKVYGIEAVAYSKSSAKSEAERLREKRGSARIIPEPRDNPRNWLVYTPLKVKKTKKKTSKTRKTRKRKPRREREFTVLDLI